MKMCVMISGNGSNLQALIDAQKEGYFESVIDLVVSSSSSAYGLDRAKKSGIDTMVIGSGDYEMLDDELKKRNIELILMAGYIKILPASFIESFSGKIINIHPSLLPNHSGMGMYGINVHKSVLESNDLITGATVHFVTKEVDEGPVIISKSMHIGEIEDAEQLQQSVLEIEHEIFKEAVRIIETNKIDGNKGINEISQTTESENMNNESIDKKVQKSALLSVTDKTGICEFAKGLSDMGYRIISTGGTLKVLMESGIEAVSVEKITNFQEMLDGRVKTLHPGVHAGILYKRNDESHQIQMKNSGISSIDIVAVNLYDFEGALKSGKNEEDIVESIDIGGPSMIRSAAKNYNDVIVLTSPSDYVEAIKRLKEDTADQVFRKSLAAKAFAATAYYDSVIAGYFQRTEKEEYPEKMSIGLSKLQDLRYGENPHQSAALYMDPLSNDILSGLQQLQGKELSFNNINDLYTAASLAAEFSEPSAAVIKHATPCAAASSSTIAQAFKAAYDADPMSIFGGIVAVNGEIDGEAALLMKEIFLEIVAAYSFTDEAIEILSEKKNLRLIKLSKRNSKESKSMDIKFTGGLVLIQSKDESQEHIEGEDIEHVYDDNSSSVSESGLFEGFETVTKVKPDADQIRDMKFAMKVCKHVKSNAVVMAKDSATIAISGGQTSRIWAVRNAIRNNADKQIKGSVMASDAFFPFEDCVVEAAEAGITAILQPGGSKSDQKSIEACDQHDISMAFTGIRHFRH